MLTTVQAARRLGLAHSTVYRRCVAGVMRAELAGGCYVMTEEEVKRWESRGRLRPGRKPRDH